MKKIALFCLAAVVAGCSDMPVDGLSRSGWDAPTSMPPANYTGDTWIDARGCVYFATGNAANRGWVPYVGKGLKQVCKG